MSDHPTEEFGAKLIEIQSRLHGYIFSLTRDMSDTDDLFQQTALILWKKLDQYDEEKSSFLSWACGIARFEVMNFLRSRSRKKLYLSDEMNLQLIQFVVEQDENELELRKEALEKCKSNLRDRDRELVNECYSDKNGIHAAASRMNRSTQSIHNSLRRIRTALFACIEKTMLQSDHKNKPNPGTES